MTHASRNTTTGLKFEEQIQIRLNGIDLSKHNLYRYLESKKINWRNIISRKLLPDEAYFDAETGVLSIFEKKYQQSNGSADEKPQTCAFKIWQFQKIGKAIGAKEVTYTYIFNEWFKKPQYKDMLDYINSVPNCSYRFVEE